MRPLALCLSLLTTLLLILAGCSESQDSSNAEATPEATPPEYPVTWRFALEEIEGSVQHAYAVALKEQVEALSDGKVELEVFPYGSLGTSIQLTELVRNGSVNLAFASPGHLANQIPEVGIFNLHYLFPDDEQTVRELLTSPELVGKFEPPYEKHNLKLLSFVPEGWMAWTANKALRSPADFQGIRFRTMTSDMAAESFRVYGAEPKQTPFSQVYNDLQLRKTDGQTNPIFAIEEMNFYEVQSTLTVARPAQFISSVVTNPEWFDALPENQKAWLESALEEVAETTWQIQKELNQVRLERMLEIAQIKVVQLTEEERAAFAKASAPARQAYVDSAGEFGADMLRWLSQTGNTFESQTPESASQNGS
ncbi:TRAP transporter substrate-binding protein DctP [Marinobacter salinisoli]|uniref:TRAP transporter substrate-binding protein DctP n=1 Tax=Marinobacter salinisoli TaxID=2769486 RepID=A0ABX7MQN3_9GAMM|nr:TRAP transporter substrate-binding protein DctP [Marinobacter salinisoli]QSP94630.1 TRAP transporter substrate-binding protein DctP [Marinobacter salinisoli]